MIQTVHINYLSKPGCGRRMDSKSKGSMCNGFGASGRGEKKECVVIERVKRSTPNIIGPGGKNARK